MLPLLVKDKDKHWLLFSSKNRQTRKLCVIFPFNQVLREYNAEDLAQRNPGAETLPGSLFLQTEPGKAWKILRGPESNILTLGSCCRMCSYIIKKNSRGVFLGSFAKVLFVATLAALVISSVVWMMNNRGLILFKKRGLNTTWLNSLFC